MGSETIDMKLVVVGDGAVGKTCMLISYAANRFPTEYVPTVFDNYVVNLQAGNTVIELGLWDTAGQDEYDRLRPLSYGSADIFLVCFSVVNPVSYENIRNKWAPELSHFCPTVPKIVVGTNVDLRNDPGRIHQLSFHGKHPTTKEEGEQLAKKIRAAKYLECSALTGEGLKEVFDEAVKTVLLKSGRMGKKGRCNIL